MKIKAIPHNYSAYIAQSDFLSDVLKFESILVYGRKILAQNDGKDASNMRTKVIPLIVRYCLVYPRYREPP